MFNRVWATPVSACDRSLVDRQLSLLCIRHVEVDARSELSLQAHLSLYRHRWSLKPVSYRRLRQVTYVGLTPRELNVCTKGDSVWSTIHSTFMSHRIVPIWHALLLRWRVVTIWSQNLLTTRGASTICTWALVLCKLQYTVVPPPHQATRGGGYYAFTLYCTVVPMYRANIVVFEHISMKCGELILTTTNSWTDYILGEIVPGTREQATTENSNRRQIGDAT